MSEILEIRDTCQNSLELLRSKTFDKYLRIYKKKFLLELDSRKDGDQKEEVLHKKEFEDNVEPEIFLEILSSKKKASTSKITLYKKNKLLIEG